MPASSHADPDLDARYMARAIRLARRGRFTARPNPVVGCVLVNGGGIVGEGHHVRAGEAHAEILALARAGSRARGATCYVTLEPCAHTGRTPPCTQALLEAGIARVVVGMQDPNPQVDGRGIATLAAAGIEARVGVMADACAALNPGFIMRMRHGRPRVRLKIAQSLDGRTATARGESRWITASAARHDVHRLRAECGAVLIGIGTAAADDPRLTVREAGDLRGVAQPLRVVLDSRLRLSPQARMLTEPGVTLVIGVAADPARARALAAAGAEVAVVDADGGRVSLPAALRELARRQVNDVLVEAGPALGGALLRADLVDELICYMAPMMLGHEAQASVRLPGIVTLADAARFEFVETRRLAGDLRLIARRAPGARPGTA